MPYIGITGYKHLHEIRNIVQFTNSFPLGKFMFGITSSNKRLLDPTKAGKTSPALRAIEEMVKAVPQHHLPMIHYFTPTDENLVDEIVALFDYCRLDSSHCGLQLNLLWPKPKLLEELRKAFEPSFKITLQLPKDALVYTDADIIKSLRHYEGLIDYALIDPSGGMGIDFDIAKAGELMLKMSQSLNNIIPGVAGGFSDENVAERINQISSITACGDCQRPKLYDFCIDAQGKLRRKTATKPVFPKDAPEIVNSSLDLGKARRYITNSLTAFCEN